MGFRTRPRFVIGILTLVSRFYVCIPAIIGGAAWTYKLEAAHHEHLEHIKHDNGGEMPAIPDYEYLNIR